MSNKNHDVVNDNLLDFFLFRSKQYKITLYTVYTNLRPFLYKEIIQIEIHYTGFFFLNKLHV